MVNLREYIKDCDGKATSYEEGHHVINERLAMLQEGDEIFG